MKISSLRNVPKSDRAAELSSVAGVFLPRYSDDAVETSINRQILTEVEKTFRVSSESNLFSSSAETRNPIIARIHNTLFSEIRDSVIAKSSIASVRDRLGQKGILAPTLYDILIPKDFEYRCGAANLSKQLVSSTIREADEVEHLSTGFDGLPGIQQFSLFVRRHPTLKDCSVLVLTMRNLAKLIVQSAWHIFHKLLGSDSSERPIKLLERLAEKYGAPFSFIGNTEVTKFVFNRQLPIELGRSENILQFSYNDRADTIFSFAVSHGVAKCVLAVVVRADEYMRDMVKAGLKGTLKPMPVA